MSVDNVATKEFEKKLFELVDSLYGIETCLGNELFQQIMNEHERVNSRHQVNKEG